MSQQPLPALGVGVILVEGLLLFLLLIYTAVNTSLLSQPGPFMYALGAFGVFVLLGRFTPVLRAVPDVRVTLECFAMIGLITIAAVSSGTDSGALANLYMLPVILAALTLGRRETGGIFISVVACRALLSDAMGQNVFEQDFLLTLFVELTPLLLLAIAVSALVYSAQVARGQVRALTYQDELTGLFNMRAFTRLLTSEHRSAQDNEDGAYTVLKVDVIGLQAINDQYDFETGNEVLKQVAEALKRSTRMNDMIARYGGDEFILMLRNADDEVARIIMNRIHQNLFNTTFPVGTKTLKPKVALGAATYPEDGNTTRDIMSHADKAMVQNKLFQKNLDAGHAKADLMRRNANTTIQ